LPHGNRTKRKTLTTGGANRKTNADANTATLGPLEVDQLERAQRTAELMFKRRIWGGEFKLSKYSIVNFLKLFGSNIWPLITFLFNVPQNSMLLDFGCGAGNYSLWLAYSLRCNVIGIDLSKNTIKAAKQTTSSITYFQKGCVLIDFVVADGMHLPFKAECFDGVFAMDVFGHLPDIDKAFLELSRLLKPSGVGSFCTESAGLTKFRRSVITLLGYDPWNRLDGHISLFTFEQLKGMLRRRGFLVKERRFEPRFLDPLVSTTWSGGGGFGWLEDFIPELRFHFRLRRFFGKALEMLYTVPLANLIAYSFRTALYRVFLSVSSLDTGEIYIQTQKAN